MAFAFGFVGLEDAGQSVHLLLLLGQPGVERHQLLLGLSLLLSTLVEQTGDFTLGRVESILDVPGAATGRCISTTV